MAVLRVREPFSCEEGGVLRVYRQGDLVSSNDPVATASRVALFLEPVEDAVSRSSTTVEQATAAPNERRSLPRKRPAEPKAGPGA